MGVRQACTCLLVSIKVGIEHIDHMIDFAIVSVSNGPNGPHATVSELARRWPDETGLQLVYTLVSAATAIEQVFSGDQEEHVEAAQTMRMAALLASDLYAMQQLGFSAPTGRDLFRYWERYDPFFLEVAKS